MQNPYQKPQLLIITLHVEAGYAASEFIPLPPDELDDDKSYTEQGNEISAYSHIEWEW